MEDDKIRAEKSSEKEEKQRLYCEKYREWILIELGCKHPKEYCQYRKQCLLYFKSKFRDL